MTGTIFLESSELSIGEPNGTVFVPVVRTGDLSGSATIEYGITPNTATDGADYVGGTGTITMQPGQDRVTIPVQILNDALFESTETFTVSIINVDNSSTLLFPRTARVNILDDENPVIEPADPPLISSYNVTQQAVITGLSEPMAFEFAPQDPSLVYVAEKGGRIRVFDLDSNTFLADFVDLTAKVNNVTDRGLMDIALHPNFPENPYVYAFYVVDPPDTAGRSGNAGPDGGGNRFAYVVRFTADAATGFKTIVSGSEVILVGAAGQTLQDISGGGSVDSTSALNQPESGFNAQTGQYLDDYIKVDSLSHAGGSLAFGPDGALYISIGDGTSYNATDPRAISVQSVDSLSGKILRVDPITGFGLPDNPFVESGASLDENRSKVYQLGLRNPFSTAFDQDGHLIITNTGWNSWEEIESGPAGANFGWPYYEGGDNGVVLRAPGYQDLPSAAAFYAAVASGAITVTPALRAFAHASAEPGFQNQAITGGDVVYTGARYPAEFQNDFFFTDIVRGEVFVVDVNDRRDVKFLYQAAGAPVHFSQGPDGYVYYADLFNGVIGRLIIGAAIQPGPGTLTARVDDVYELYVNGTLVLADSNYRDAETLQIVLQPGDQIAVHAVDTGGLAAAFFDIGLPDGTHIGSSSNWLLSKTATGNWTAAGFDDSSWVTATQYGGPSTQPWASDAAAPLIPSDSPGQWIWSNDNNNDNEIYLRFTMPGASSTSAPVAANDTASTSADLPATINVLANDTDPNGDALTIIAVSDPPHGTAVINTNGTPGNPADDRVVYTPDAGFSGTDQFTYTVSDGTNQDVATVAVTVAAQPGTQSLLTARVDDVYELYVNGTLVLADGNFRDAETLQIVLQPGDQIAVHAVDTGGLAAAFFDIGLPDGTHIGSSSNWLLSKTATGNWTAAGFDDSSWVTATQYGGPSTQPWASNAAAPFIPSDSPGQWIWSNDNNNDNEIYLRFTMPGASSTSAPVAANDTASTSADLPATINVLANDTDPNGDALTITSVHSTAGTDGRSDQGATVTITGSGANQRISYDGSAAAPIQTLAAGATLTDRFSYVISDGHGGTATAVTTVTVTGVNDLPLIKSNGGGSTAAVSVAENSTAVTTVLAIDPDVGQSLVYAIIGGADAGKFTIGSSTGALSFLTAPNFELPTDAGGNNVYDVMVQASDGQGGIDTQAIAVTVTDVFENSAPTITSNGGGNTAAVSLAENTTAITTVTATDPNIGQTLSYAIIGGADAGKFTIGSSTGALSFLTAPNFELPTDAGGNNVYDVMVQASDGQGGIDTQAIAVTVTDVFENSAPTITSNGGGNTAAVSLAENTTAITTVTATDPNIGQTLSYAIIGGADAGKFTIGSSTGALSFLTAPNFELPTDAGGNNVYDVMVQASDGQGGIDTQAIAVTVTDVFENSAPTITSNGGGNTAAVSLAENTTAITTVTATDPNIGQALSYAIIGGADAGKFTLSPSTGALAFVAGPNFEAPGDANGDNVYDVTVQVSDGSGGVDSQQIAITVTNVDGISPPPSDAATITGTTEDDVLTGQGGANTINALAGNDTLNGAGGNDTLNAGLGNDTLIGGTGSDKLNGDDGNDVFSYTFGDGADAVNGGAGLDILKIVGTTADNTLDVVYNGTALTTFEGGTVANVETVTADLLSGVDTLTYAGTNSAVSVNLATGTGSGFASIANIENVTGGSGNDALVGDGLANSLSGGSGNDWITGSGGNDALTGGSGNDNFVFAPNFGRDTVAGFDYNPGGGQDLLDISAFGITAATFANRVTLADPGSDIVITIDGNANQVITLEGVPSTGNITAADFILFH